MKKRFTLFLGIFLITMVSFNSMAQTVGCMTVATFTNGPAGIVNIDIEDPTNCSDPDGYDQILVSGAASLDGTLNVLNLPGFTMPTSVAGLNYTIITASSVAGTFATVNFPTMPGSNPTVNLVWSITYSATSVVVNVVDPCDDDVTPPLVFAPDDVSVGTNPNTQCSRVYTIPNLLTNNTGNPGTKFDACGTTAITDIIINGIGGYTPSNQTLPLGVNTITYIVSDFSGNTASDSYDVTVEDDDMPIITCPYGPAFVLNVNSDAGVDNVPGDCGATVVWNQPVVSDNCPGASAVELPSTPPGAAYNTLINVGTYTITYQATDAAGNTSTCLFTLNVIDNQPPTSITCPTPANPYNADAGECNATLTFAATATDNCTANLTYTYRIGSLTGTIITFPYDFPVGTTTVYAIASDGFNSIDCNFSVTVEDNEVPTITCPGDVTVDTDAGICTASGVALGTPVTGDNCSVASTTNNSVEPYVLGNTNVIWTVTDDSGNTATCTQIVTVEVNEIPTITCPSDVTVDTDAGICTASGVLLGTPTTGDNCSVASTTNNSTEPYALGNTNVIWTVTDGSGNTATCTQIVTVEDNENPTITCPANVTVDTDAGICTASGVSLGTPTTGDNCSVALTTNNSVEPYALGNTNVVWTVTDGSGNTATCTQIVTVEDNEVPTITCPTDVTVDTDPGICTASGVALGTPTAGDNCSVVFTTNNSVEPYVLGNTNVVWTVTDGAGNTATCTQVVTVDDNEVPTITCPSDVTVSTDAGICTASGVSLGIPTTGDNCSVASTTNNSVEPYVLGNTNVVWTVTDGSGNTATCTQVVTVEDNEVPTITCPSDVTVSTDAGICTASGVSLGIPTTGDNCSVASTTNNSVEPYVLGSTNVIWTVTDGSGNTATCTQIITVEDNENPTFICPLDLTVNTNNVSNCEATMPDLVALTLNVDDNCSITVATAVTQSVTAGTTISVTANQVISYVVSVTDDAGNTATCSVNILFNDATPPVVVCPVDETINTNGGLTCNITIPDYIANINPTDNCSTTTESQDESAGAYTSSGHGEVINMNYSVEQDVQSIIVDQSQLISHPRQGFGGNSASAIFPGLSNFGYGVQLGANNKLADDIIVPSGQKWKIDSVILFVYQTGSTTTSTINDVRMQVTSGATPGGSVVFGNLTTNRLLSSRFTGIYRTTSTTLLNTQRPIMRTVVNTSGLELPAGTYWLEHTVGGSSALSGPWSPLRTINSATTGNGYQQIGSGAWNPLNDSGFAQGITFMVYGNLVTSCDFTITVNDDDNPTITCPSDVTVDTDAGLCTASGVSLGIPTTSDNCSVASTTNNSVEPYLLGNTNLIWTVTDGAGNTATCTQIVTVEDNELPTITCPSDVTVSTDAGICTASGVSLGIPTTGDNCSVASTTNNSVEPYVLGSTNVIWTVTDGSGNTATCTQVVTVEDNEVPIANCNTLPYLVTLDNTGNYSLTATEINNLGNGTLGSPSTDNCSIASYMLLSNVFDCDDSNTGIAGNNIVTRTLVVTDGSGNTVTCTASFEILPLDPYAVSSTSSICSDVEFTIDLQDSIINLVPTDFNWTVSYDAGLTNTSYVGIQTSNTITETGGITNTTNGPLNAVYTINTINPASSCAGVTFVITKVINPEPQVTSQAFTSTTVLTRLQVCSDVAVNITLPDDDNGAPTVATYNITNINSNGLIASAGNPVTGSGFLNSEIADDAWTNTTNANVDVIYTIVPVTALGCEGNPFTITVRIRPEPVIDPINVEVCSDEALGFGAQLQNPASNGIGIGQWTFAGLTHPNMSPSAGGQSVIGPWPYTLGNNFLNRISLTNDQFNNVTSFDQTATYSIFAIGTDPAGPLVGCVGDTFNVTALVHPEPVGQSPPLSEKCSGVEFSFDLNTLITNIAPDPDSIEPITYEYEIASQVPLALVVMYDEFGNLLNNGQVYPLTGSVLTVYGDNYASLPITVNIEITPTSKYGCVGTPFIIPVKINNNPQVFINTNGDNDLCEGEMRTLLGNAVPAGAPPIPYTYTWSFVGPSGDASLLPVGTNNVKLTAPTNATLTPSVTLQLVALNTLTGCLDSTTVTIDILPLPEISPIDLFACATVLNGTSAIFDLDDAALLAAGETYHLTESDAVNNLGALSPSNYTGSNGQVIWVRLNGSNGCYAIASFTLHVQNLPTVEISGDLNICLGEETMLIPTLGFSTYFWTPIENGNDTIVVNPIETTTYTLNVTDGNGCENSASVTVVVNDLPTATIAASDTEVCEDSEVTLTASGGDNYNWQGGPNTSVYIVEPSVTSEYFVTVTDVNGCTDVDSITITVWPSPDFTVVPQDLFLCASEIGGNQSIFNLEDAVDPADLSNSSFHTSQSDAENGIGSITNPETYTGNNGEVIYVSLFDINGCRTVGSFVLNVYSLPYLVTPVVSNVKCNGESTGSFDAVILGGSPGMSGYEILIEGSADPISQNDTGVSVTGLPADTYLVTVTDENGCSSTYTFEITQPAPLIANTQVTDALCNGGTGLIHVSVNGGSPNYTYFLDYPNDPTTNNNLIAAPGSYTLTVEDGEDCTVEVPVLVGQPSDITISITSTNESCEDENDGTATAIVSGGTPGYTYVWSNGQTTAIATGLPNGTHSVVVTDNNGCTDEAFVIITTNAPAPAAVINCPSDITLNVQDCDISYSWVAPTIVDNCETIELVVALDGAENEGLATGIQQANFSVGSYHITYTQLGPDTIACDFYVTVIDTVAPLMICPPTETVVCLENVPPVYTYHLDFTDDGGVLEDNCAEILASFTFVSADSIGGNVCINKDTILRIYSITDISGNVGMCTHTIIVNDTIAPTFTSVPANTTIDCDNLAAISSPSPATAVDNCASGGATITYNDTNNQNVDPSECGHYNYSINRTWTATDDCGNFRDSLQVISVQDTTAPIALCLDITVNLDPMGNATILASDINNTSTDNCMASGLLELNATPTSFTCANVGDNNVILSVTDACGNESTCVAVVNIADIVPPVAICESDITINLDGAGSATIDTTMVNNGSYDNCEIDTMFLSNYSYDCSDVSTSPNQVTLTVVDTYGNSSTCTTNVTVIDAVPPIALCQNVSVNLDNTGNGSTTAAAVDNGSSDACGIQSITLDVTTFNCSDVGANPVVLTVTDVNGNSSTCPANVQVIDAVPPIALCQDVTVNLDNTGNGSTTAAAVDNGSSDACGIQSITLDVTTFNCTDVGANPVVLTVTDVNGNSSTCPANVQVIDAVPPIALCQDVTVNLDNTGNGSTTAAAVDNGSSDACGIQSITLDVTKFNCTDVGANPVVLTVTDVNGNSSTCPANVQVIDAVPPIALCQDVTVNLDNTGNGSTTAAAVDNGSSDACGIQSITLDVTTFNCTDVGANPVVLTVTDVNGNSSTCPANVQVIDAVPPIALCQDVTVNLDNTGNGSTTAAAVDNGSSDACGIQSITLDVTTFNCTDVGANPVVLTVTDVNGNSSTCPANVQVIDAVPPIALCQDVTVNLDNTGNGSTTATAVDNGSSDACGIQSMTLDVTTFNCTDVGANPVVLTITDVNGNSSTCSANVQVIDAVPPIALCKDVTINLDNTGVASISGIDIDNGSSDACGILSWVPDVSSFNCSDVGVSNPVILTVTDINGNSSTCSANVTVEDDVAPIALCQDITINLDNTGNGSTTASAVDNGSNDACGVNTLSLDITTFDCDDVGPVAVVLTVTDINGNSSTCSAIVTVEDVTPPQANCQNITVALNANNNTEVTITASMVNNNSTDACGVAGLGIDEATFDCSELGPNTVILTVSDVNTNSSTCSAVVTVVDATKPAFTNCLTDITLPTDQNGCFAPYEVPFAAITDNCTPVAGLTVSVKAKQVANNANIPMTIVPAMGGGYTIEATNDLPVGNNRIVVKATDASGNVDSCVWFVQVNDIWTPIIQNCPPDTVNAVFNQSTCKGQAFWAPPTASDNCIGVSLVTQNGNQFFPGYANFPIGNTTVIYTATDLSGNSTSCSFVVKVVGVCPPDLSPEHITGNTAYAPGQMKNVVLRIRNLANNPTTAQITFYVSKIDPNFSITFDPNATTTTVGSTTYTISNTDWDITEEASRWRFDSKPGVVINGTTQNLVGIKLMANGMSGATGKLITTVKLGTGGGETPTTNNKKTSNLSIN